jgi:cobalt-zinc-cadmium efflux system outer membrane protein
VNKEILKFVFWGVLPLFIAGCASPNPKPAFNDVDKTVNARLGQSLEWQNTNETEQTVAVLLQTNLTAQSAVTIALLNNKSLQAEFEEIGISQADLAQASRLHNLEFAGSWRLPDRPPSYVDAEYSVSADFLDLLTLPARKKIAARNLEQTKLEVADKVLQLAADAQTAFYTLQAQMELTNRLALIVAINDAAADFAHQQYDAGNIPKLSLTEQEASAAESRLDWMHAQVETEMKCERLNRLLGLSGEQINWTIADELPLLPANELSLTNLEALAVNQRLDMAAKRVQMESIAAALRLKKHTRFIPGAAIGLDAERMPDGQDVTVIGPTLDLEIPIFDQGQAAVAKLSAEFRQASDNYAALEVNVRSEVRQAMSALLAAREETEFSQKSLLPLNQQLLGEALLHYNAMEESPYELLLSKEREQTAEEDSITALRDYWLARVELERAIGGRLTGKTTTPKPQP